MRPATKMLVAASSSSSSSSSSAAFQVEVAVIGAGVIGLAISRALAMAGKEVIIMDRAGTIGSETSSRNSEVIHAGLYYPKGSYKAKFCVNGKKLLYDYCQSRGIDYRNCGKLIVATQQQQLEGTTTNNKLQDIQQKAIENGVLDTRILSQSEVLDLEPNLSQGVVGALWSPSTGVLDSHSFMMSLLADSEDAGATLALHSNLNTTTTTGYSNLDEDDDTTTNNNNLPPSSQTGGGIFLPLDENDDEDTTTAWLECQTVINSTGLWAHHVARAIHKNHNYGLVSSSCLNKSSSWTIPQQFYAKGNYFRLEGCRNPFERLVYPLPEPGGLGVHATIDWSGQSTKFGPDVEWIERREVEYPEEIDLAPNPQRAERFYEEIRKYWEGLPDDSLVPDYSGIRPKLHHPSIINNHNHNNNNKNNSGDSSATAKSTITSAPFHDFWIASPEEHGIPGLIHLFGMESPGLTSSMAIAQHIASVVKSWE